ncbi:flavin reductase [Amycolatopsis pithecellobii]|uniref:flavin reductase n=1 Tax=Amycolatopsis pithecellobii TaxID=664692 RepID=UPI0028AC4AB1|nr:flavin reductase [Amycolatopsis pithecellobii]
MTDPRDPQHFRTVLGHFPTGVAAVTSIGEDGGPIGMIVGSFTSVSLDPPLVAFLPAKRSRTGPRIVGSGRFLVNVLGAHQELISRAFAAGGDSKFDSVGWTRSPGGLPLLDDAVAWIECDIEAVHEAGDHDIVVGEVCALEAVSPAAPLIFFQGGYGRFASLSLAAAGEPDLIDQLRLVDVARPFMAELAASTEVECLASSAIGEESVLLATAGRPVDGRTYSRVGQRLPLDPPLGAALVAWSPAASSAWKARAHAGTDCAGELDQLLARVRDRGWSVTTWSDDLRALEATVDDTLRHGVTPQARRSVRELVGRLTAEHEPADLARAQGFRSVTVPVMGGGEVVLQLTLRLPFGTGSADLDRFLAPLRETAQRVSTALNSSLASEGSR